MKIHYFGAARTVTGSQYLLEVNGERLLLECGLFQGRRAESNLRNTSFEFPVETVDAAILSHAHLDHTGNFPNLVKHGFSGPIYAAHATAHIADLVMRDSGHIQEADAIFVNKKRARRNEPPIEPLYTGEDAAKVTPLLNPQDYRVPFHPIKGVIAQFVDAGHILGSAGVVLDIEEGNHKFRLWFSGDIGRPNMPLLNDPVLPEGAPEILMMECTYGNRLHNDPEDAFDEFRRVVLRTFRRGGKVIVPAFAIGRTQELVYELNRMIANHDLPSIPVYVDSPLAVNASQIFLDHQSYFDPETQQFIREQRHPALNFPELHYIRSVDESKALNERKEPMVIISASGMAEAGRILHHLRNNIENPRNTIAIVSWQAPDTLGRRLAEKQSEVRIYGETFERRAEVATINGLSAHAGQDDLVKYAKAAAAGGKLKEIILIHGEQDAADALTEKLEAEELGARISFPDWKAGSDF
jgi:metallo-beta-lactamase family protein